MEALPARQAPPHTIISRPVQTALALWRLRSGAAASFRHPLGRAGPAPGSVGAPTSGPLPLGTVPDPPAPPEPPAPAPPPDVAVPPLPVAAVPPPAPPDSPPEPSVAGPPGWVAPVPGVSAASRLPPDRHPAAVKSSKRVRTKAAAARPPGRAGEGGLSGIPTVTVRKPLRPRGRGLEVGAQGGVARAGTAAVMETLRIARRSGGAGAPDRRRSCGWGSWEPV